MSSQFSSTYTLTFGNQAENHCSMQVIGKTVDNGLSLKDLKLAKASFEDAGCECILHHLNELLPKDIKAEDAYLLVIRNGVSAILGEDGADKLYEEQKPLKKDTKALMYGRVVNKKARHNLCFSDFTQEPEYEKGKGTVYNFVDLPLLQEIRKQLPKFILNKNVTNLQCEGNYYYDVAKTYIGFHGDSERQIVVGVRLGLDFPLHYRWYKNCETLGEKFTTVLSHGDIYIMSEKAVGSDWKRKSIYTLRHAAGLEKYL
jgi:hypothetical protein